MEKIDLLPFETSLAIMEEPGVTSITFFEGNIKLIGKKIKDRFQEIVNANPWLSGKIIKQNKEISLQFSNSPEIEQLYHPDIDTVSVSDEMSYEQITQAVKSCTVQRGRHLINKLHPLTLLSILPDKENPSEKFAVILSISHVIADGFTYYSILNMFSDDIKIESLNVNRKLDVSKQIPNYIGKDLYKFTNSISLGINSLKGLVFGKKVQCFAYYVDTQKINAIKADLPSNIPFVSTNDILQSSISKAVDARLSMMAINFRNRIEGINNNDAGNYEAGLFFDKVNYYKPQNIRSALNSGVPMKTTSSSIPSFFETLGDKFTQITNWASFASGIVIDGTKQKIHIPIYDLSLIPFDCAIIFKPVADKTAVMFLSKTLSKNHILAQCEVEEPVDNVIFKD
ncbi:hypothetical protein [Flammeovirga kamogawensis]|uniref:Condensation domain-containing protein n=1 Tax=Flammeovirga kamogawensis TaxID=373891 RepID=A0ABX8H1V1_9BACT|nr:hypothetical protein [Flammeovirga kamogawensis]MBB6462203.1 hypothetical protein [Flammeovirga kamogawensis]QWG09396.1 hypothetical protein KM029_22580 [Flammeovirga kamogawensis]TRX64914.1 hypothetical protein EO216_20490 [Flammeovirga kamogawensis]